jgi:dTDP-4-dehydrorhamnose 3,5-epimerase
MAVNTTAATPALRTGERQDLIGDDSSYEQTLPVPPRCLRGLGDVIQTANTPQLIAGVELRPYALWSDDRGYFVEAMRSGCGLVSDFPAKSTQVSATLSYPGTIKAFHYHRHQIDCWIPVLGMLQVALVDLRSDSPTYGRKNTLYVGVLRPWQILIPPGVGHGYKAIAPEPSMLIYVTNRFYNPNDEGRIPYDDANINYDWSMQFK